MSDMDVNGAKLRTITAHESDFNCGLLSKNEMNGFAVLLNPNAKGKTKDDTGGKISQTQSFPELDNATERGTLRWQNCRYFD